MLIDDPGAFDEPWTAEWDILWTEGQELQDYVCQENNKFLIDMLDDDGSIQRLAVAHRDPALEALARSLENRYPPLPGRPQGWPGSRLSSSPRRHRAGA